MNRIPIPARYLQTSDAPVTFGDNGANAKTKPVNILARTPDPVRFFDWDIYHDFEGMSHKTKIPIDYAHYDAEVIGYANRFEIDGEGLHLSGALTPANDGDRASEIMEKAEQGVPWQASIFTSQPIVEEIGPDMVSQVNGRQVTGPALIVREWELLGVAVCPYGADSNTMTMFSDKSEMILATLKEEMDMADEHVDDTAVEEVVEPVELEDAEQVEADAEAPAVEASEPDSDASDAESVEADVSEPEAPVDEPRAELKKYMDAFGAEKGAKWFADNKSYEEALRLYADELKAENERLKSAVENDGEAPVSMTPEPVETATEKPTAMGAAIKIKRRK